MKNSDAQKVSRVEAIVFDNPSLNKAYEWAINQNYTSVAAQYAKTLAEAIRQIRKMCETE